MREPDEQPADEHGGRGGGVARQVQEGAARVHAFLPFEQPGGERVADEAECGEGHDQRAVHRRRVQQAADGLVDDQRRDRDQGHGVDQGDEDLPAPVGVRQLSFPGRSRTRSAP